MEVKRGRCENAQLARGKGCFAACNTPHAGLIPHPLPNEDGYDRFSDASGESTIIIDIFSLSISIL